MILNSKIVIGFKNYRIYDNGTIYSYYKNKFIIPGCDNGGYLKVYLYKNKKRFNLSLHRLVAKHFLKNYSNKLEVNHKDFNKKNNSINNLEMMTSKENWKHAQYNGKMNNLKTSANIESIKRRKLTMNDVNNIREEYLFRKNTSEMLSKKYNVSLSAIKNIISRRTYNDKL